MSAVMPWRAARAVVTGVLASTLLLAAPAVAAGRSGPPAGAGAQPPGRVDACHGVPLVAHRGGHDAQHTEDTRESLLRGAELGAGVVEGDLHLTRDHRWVVLHDDTVDRTTDGAGPISAYSLAAASRLRTQDGEHGLGTLTSVLDALADHPTVGLQLEIKPAEVGRGDLTRLLRRLGEYGVHDRLLITSFVERDLAQVRAHSAGWHTALITEDPHVDLALAARHGEAIVAAADLVDRAFLDRAHRAHLRVYAWSVNTRAEWRRLVVDGTDAIVTDRLRAMQAWCAHGLGPR